MDDHTKTPTREEFAAALQELYVYLDKTPPRGEDQRAEALWSGIARVRCRHCLHDLETHDGDPERTSAPGMLDAKCQGHFDPQAWSRDEVVRAGCSCPGFEPHPDDVVRL